MVTRRGLWTLTRAEGVPARLSTRGSVLAGPVRTLANGDTTRLDEMGRLPIRILASTESVNAFGFIVENGAFAGALEVFNPNPILLAYHDFTYVIGKAPVRITEAGLEAIGWVTSALVNGTEMQMLVLDGTMAESSIGFNIIGEREGDDGIMRVTDLELVEISLVAAGANRDTFVQPLAVAVPALLEDSKEPSQIPQEASRPNPFEDALDRVVESYAGLGRLGRISLDLAEMAVTSAETIIGGDPNE